MKASTPELPKDSPQDAGISRLYLSTPRDEPPGWIDERLLTEADRAAASYRQRRWGLAATAALLMLGLSLSYQVFRETAPPPSFRAESEQDTARPAAPAMSAPAPAPLTDNATQVAIGQAQVAVPPSAPRLPAEAAKTRAAAPKLQEMAREQGAVAIPESADAPASLGGRAAKSPSRDDLLTRIRARIQAGDSAAATASIVQLLLAYPQQPLPKDLESWRRNQAVGPVR